MKTRSLLIVGNTSFAEIAALYFQRDTHYNVIGYAVDKDYIGKGSIIGSREYDLADINNHLDKSEVDVYVAVTYSKINTLRAVFTQRVQEMGFTLASYISPHAYVDSTASLGEHIFIFENNVIQPYVVIGSNCVLWSGNHIGHHSRLGNNCFISSHVVLSGHCTVGKNTFIGVNSTISNNNHIGDFCWISPGSRIYKDIRNYAVIRHEHSEISTVPSTRMFQINIQ